MILVKDTVTSDTVATIEERLQDDGSQEFVATILATNESKRFGGHPLLGSMNLYTVQAWVEGALMQAQGKVAR